LGWIQPCNLRQHEAAPFERFVLCIQRIHILQLKDHQLTDHRIIAGNSVPIFAFFAAYLSCKDIIQTSLIP
jgi:hypothetical protein